MTKTNWNPRTDKWGMPAWGLEPESVVAQDEAGPIDLGHTYGTEEIAVADSLGRVASSEVRAKLPVPCQPLAAEEGMALRAEDTLAARLTKSVKLEDNYRRTNSRSDAGKVLVLPPNEQHNVGSFGFLLPGANAVLPLMSPHYKGTRQRDKLHYRIIQPVAPGTNVIAVGADFDVQRPLLFAGRRITPGDIATLCMAGIQTVSVHKRPRVAICMLHRYFQPAERLDSSAGLPDAILPMVRALLLRWGVTADTVETIDDLKPPDCGSIEPDVWKLAHAHDITIVLGLLGGSSTFEHLSFQNNWASIKESSVYLSEGDEADDTMYGKDRSPYKPAHLLNAGSYGQWHQSPTLCKMVVSLNGLPLSVLTSMYLVVRPMLDALAGVGQRLWTGRNSFPFGARSAVWRDAEGARLREPEVGEQRCLQLLNPDVMGMSQRQGVRWLNGVLAAPAPRDAERHWLQLAKFDHSEPGRVGLIVLPSQEHQVSGLFHAEAMVAIEKGTGEMPIGTAVQFFLLD